jgi:hypothetical protein
MSTPARGKGGSEKEPNEMELSDNEDITKPPSILKKGTVAKGAQSPDKKKTRKSTKDQTDGGDTGKGGKTRGRSKSREKGSSGGAGWSKSRTGSKTPKPRSTSKTPKARSSSKGAKAKKTATESYAKKAAATPKSSAKKKPKKLNHSKYVGGVMEMSKSGTLRTDVYAKLMKLLTICQSAHGAKTARVANYKDPEGVPIATPSQMPSLHVQVTNYFWFPPGNRMWNGNTIPVNKTRKIEFCFLMEADVPIEEIVWTVGIDLIDLGITLEVKTCQAISHKSLMHFMYINNRFNRAEFEGSLMQQLAEFQKDVHEYDPTSYLGRKEAAKKKIPTLTVKLDYPFNGPWEKTRDGKDTRFKRTFVVEYSTEDEVYVETLMGEFKKAGKIKEYWGEWATFHYAPAKDDETVSSTAKLRWHRICDAHSCTMLSTGVVMLWDIKDPDRKIKVEYWKPKHDKMEFMSLRDVLHSIKVTDESAGSEVNVIHGLCPAPGGGWEAGVASSLPQAHTTGTNIAAHPAGWIMGYLKAKGWKEGCIKQLLKHTFTAQAVASAEKSSWDRKTGVVKSDMVDETEQELLDIEQSWVDMSLLNSNNVEDSAVKEGETVAFNWADGGSVKTMATNQFEAVSDAETSVVYSSEEEDESESSEEEGSVEEEKEEEDYASARESEEEDMVNLVDSDGDSEELDPMNLEEKLWTDIADLEDPVTELFFEDEQERDNIWTMLLGGVVTSKILRLAEKYRMRRDREMQVEYEMMELVDPETAEEEGYGEVYKDLEKEYNSLQLLKKSNEVRLRDALRKLLAEQLPAAQDKDDDASAHVKNSVAFEDEAMQDNAQSEDGGRSSE